MKKNYYECYSYNLMKYLQEGGERPIRATIHHTTRKTIWIFEMNTNLSNLLLSWTKRRFTKNTTTSKT